MGSHYVVSKTSFPANLGCLDVDGGHLAQDPVQRIREWWPCRAFLRIHVRLVRRDTSGSGHGGNGFNVRLRPAMPTISFSFGGSCITAHAIFGQASAAIRMTLLWVGMAAIAVVSAPGMSVVDTQIAARDWHCWLSQISTNIIWSSKRLLHFTSECCFPPRALLT